MLKLDQKRKARRTIFLVDWSRRHETPAGKATAEDPTGDTFPRGLKRCPITEIKKAFSSF
ncbi:hypothetical protein CIB95_05990 [Lottiidibacillus patelloidae]|uniref:Uncharacterized protein n=1 Tax=Lottiidibacillus patelloidae TaxID=2670334 RepID=A0A263BW11_9BACI|nr:hypothetical protein CIB95_05990 [Lottiidibacillus patelloidae]